MEDKKIMDPETEQNEESKKDTDYGEIKLMVPIRSGDKDVNILKFDFRKLTSKDILRSMNADPQNNNPFNINAAQMMFAFSIAAAKAMDGVDEYDIRERLSAFDAIAAMQVAKLFFATKARSAKVRFGDA